MGILTISDLEKRQTTLQLCICASSELTVKPSIIFGGKGTIKGDEKSKYEKKVGIYIQKYASLDDEVNTRCHWKTLIHGMKLENKMCCLLAISAFS